MFIGHFGVGLAAKAAAPAVSLGTLFLAAQFIDLLWPTLLLAGIEHVRIVPGAAHGPPLEFVDYPVSHSLLAVAGWALLLALAYAAVRRRARGAIVVAAAVLSHWALDALVHVPDLPLRPGGARLVGLGLWSMPAIAAALELALFAAGLAVYLRVTRAVDATGRWALAGLVVFLVAVQVANSVGPPPPSVEAIAWAGQAQWMLVAWGYWIDRHRRASLREADPGA